MSTDAHLDDTYLQAEYVNESQDPQTGDGPMTEHVNLRTYTHPYALPIGVDAGWADPETDPAPIDWMVTVPCRAHLGSIDRDQLPQVTDGDDAARATWVRADSYDTLVSHPADTHDGTVFPAHLDMLKRSLTTREAAPASAPPGPRTGLSTSRKEHVT